MLYRPHADGATAAGEPRPERRQPAVGSFYAPRRARESRPTRPATDRLPAHGLADGRHGESGPCGSSRVRQPDSNVSLTIQGDAVRRAPRAKPRQAGAIELHGPRPLAADDDPRDRAPRRSRESTSRRRAPAAPNGQRLVPPPHEDISATLRQRRSVEAPESASTTTSLDVCARLVASGERQR